MYMDDVRLNFLNGDTVFPSLIEDVNNLNEFSNEKLKEFIELRINSFINGRVFSEDEYNNLAKKFGLSLTVFYSSFRLINIFFKYGAKLSEPDFISDLKKLKIKEDKIPIISTTLKTEWEKNKKYIRTSQAPTVPTLTGLKWDVNIMLASSLYLKEPEIVVLLTLIGNDGVTKTSYPMLLDIENFSWLETALAKIRKEILNAETVLNKLTKTE